MKNLLVYAYSADSSNQVFSHQLPVIDRIATNFEEVTVVVPTIKKSTTLWTHEIPQLNKKIKVLEVPWSQNRTFRNTINLFRETLGLINKQRIDVVFYFMTETHAAILSPFLWSKKIPQFLWYAHASKPLRLLFVKPFMKFICSSTSGSMPLRGNKIRLVGQMVDETLFKQHTLDPRFRYRIIHVGRFDPSKHIEALIESFLEINSSFPETKLSLYGSPTTESGFDYESDIKAKYSKAIKEKLLTILPAVPRSSLSSLYKENGVFVHAFEGSLDKTIVEATLAGLPVATLNKEYIRDFGSWGNSPVTLVTELESILKLSQENLQGELDRRRNLALERHSLNQWAKQIGSLLVS